MTSTIFISHKTEDKEHANRILEFLRAHDYPDDRLFLDSDAKSGMIVGRRWKKSLYEKLESCACLIVIGTFNWNRSKWCHHEAFVADARGIPIIVLQYDQQADLSELNEYQAIQNFVPDDAGLSRLRAVLGDHELEPPRSDENLSRGWERENRELSAEEQNEVLDGIAKRLQNLGPDRVTRRMVFGIFAILTVVPSIILLIALLGEEVANWIDPPKEHLLTLGKFVDLVANDAERSDLKGDIFVLTGLSPNLVTGRKIVLNERVTIELYKEADRSFLISNQGHQTFQLRGRLIQFVDLDQSPGEESKVAVAMDDVEITPSEH